MDNKKQEIISLLDTMDNNTLEWLLYLIKLRHKSGDNINYSMNPDVKEIWDKACKLMEVELTEVSYNTWIKGIVPIEIAESNFKLGIVNQFNKEIIEGRYIKLIKDALFYVTDINFDVEFIV